MPRSSNIRAANQADRPSREPDHSPDPAVYPGFGTAFVHYRSDTERGSSGAPVFNDQFDVVALHHKAVPAYDQNGERLARDGRVWTPDQGEDELQWVANEGVRISAIFKALDRLTHAQPQPAH